MSLPVRHPRFFLDKPLSAEGLVPDLLLALLLISRRQCGAALWA